MHTAATGGAPATRREEDFAQLNAMYFQQPLEQLTVIQHGLYQVIVDQDHQINSTSAYRTVTIADYGTWNAFRVQCEW